MTLPSVSGHSRNRKSALSNAEWLLKTDARKKRLHFGGSTMTSPLVANKTRITQSANGFQEIVYLNRLQRSLCCPLRILPFKQLHHPQIKRMSNL